MGDRYTLALKCAHCGHLNEDVYYAESSGFTTFRCSECREVNDIILVFEARKQLRQARAE